MAYEDLRQFIEVLERSGELRRIRQEIDPILEIAEITDRVSKAVGPALLFENVRGSTIPVLINAFGSKRRMELALQTDSVEAIAERVHELLDFKSPQGLFDKIKMIPKLADLNSFFPRIVRDGPCRQVVLRQGEFSLHDLPVLQCWPQDAGRFITLPLVFTHNPATGKRNCGIYRMQIYDEQTTAMHWQLHKHGAAHFREAGRQGSRMPVAVAIGADPAVVFAGALPLPDDFDEMMLAGFLRGKPVEMVRCETNDLEVPANAEIVLEGYVDPSDMRTEGPFGDHTGFYSLADPYPAFHVTCMTRRHDPIYQTIIVGRPPQEDCYMGAAIERIFLPVIQKQLPEIVDMHMPFEGIFHNLILISIRKAYPGHARKIMNAVWGLGQMMFSKCIVIVDQDVNVHDPGEVVWKVLNHIDPERDIQFTLGPIDVLDHSSRLPAFGSKMGIDGTRKWKDEGFNRAWPDEIIMSPEVVERVDRIWKELGLDKG